MMKFWLTLAVLAVLCQCLQVDGASTVKIAWEEPGTRWVQNTYFARGKCEYEFDRLYRQGGVLLNVTFDRKVSQFDDFSSWHRIRSSTRGSSGTWFYSSSQSTYNPHQPVMIEFEVHWDYSAGMAPPTGYCVTSVGHPLPPSTPSLRPIGK